MKIKHLAIVHRGCSDEEKIITNTRMLAMITNGFRYNHEEKIDQMIEFCDNNQ